MLLPGSGSGSVVVDMVSSVGPVALVAVAVVLLAWALEAWVWEGLAFVVAVACRLGCLRWRWPLPAGSFVAVVLRRAVVRGIGWAEGRTARCGLIPWDMVR